MVERITPNHEFIRSEIKAATIFFTYGMLIGKWYSRKAIADSKGLVHEPSLNKEQTNNKIDKDDESTPWCYCNEPSSGEMILYDNKRCTIKWFRFTCLKIASAPPLKGNGIVLAVLIYQDSANINKLSKLILFLWSN